jgi:tRNA 2-selenouridine synthase
MRSSELIEIIVGDNRRKQRILDEYGVFPVPVLSETTDKISKRLGPQHAKKAKQLLEEGDLSGWLEVVLHYYDKLYAYGSSQRLEDKKFCLDMSHLNSEDFADALISFVSQKIIRQSVISSK